MKLDEQKIIAFQDFIWDYYKNYGRPFAWRNVDNPYYVLVSEIMLQQTQTYRVVEKYEEFIATFPSFESLASATLRDVLSVWQGLGYYRRARYLHKIAHIIVNNYAGKLPNNEKVLQTFPGIGCATASSICAFAFNKPTVFIETNIRAVFIHSFFKDKNDIKDKEIMPLIEATVDKNNPRQWYYALMDYGVELKKRHINPSRKSAHYNKQSKFEGSDRQIRAKILKLITNKGIVPRNELFSVIKKDVERIEKIIKQLENEQFIIKTDDEKYKVF